MTDNPVKELGDGPKESGPPSLKKENMIFIYIYRYFITILYFGPFFKKFGLFSYNFTLILL